MREDLLLADPSRVQTIIRSIHQEACRPTHFREVDVHRVTVANHPGLLTLDGRPKWEGRDMLGKPNKYLTKGMPSPSGSRWRGHDTEHLSINYLAAIALLTGNLFAREECQHHAMLYLTGFTYNSGTWNDSIGPARKVGRSSLAAIWIWLVTDREDVMQRVVDRARDVKDKVFAPTYAIPVVASKGSYYWTVWEEGNAACGLAAIHHNFDAPHAREAALEVSRVVTLHGYARKTSGSWRCAYKPPFRFANGSTYYAALDPEFDTRAAGGGLTMWGMPGVYIAAEYHPNPDVRNAALEIIHAEYAGPMNGMSEVLSWICISPKVAAIAKMESEL